MKITLHTLDGDSLRIGEFEGVMDLLDEIEQGKRVLAFEIDGRMEYVLTASLVRVAVHD